MIEVETGAVRFQVTMDTFQPFGHISADNYAMATFFNKRVEVSATPSGDLLGVIPSHGYLEAIGRHLLGPKGTIMIGAVAKRGCVAFDVASGNIIHDLLLYWPDRLALSGNGQRLIVGGKASPVDDGYLALVDVPQGKQIHDIDTAYSIEEVDISYNGTQNAV